MVELESVNLTVLGSNPGRCFMQVPDLAVSTACVCMESVLTSSYPCLLLLSELYISARRKR